MLSVHRSILRGDMNIFGSSVTKGLMTGLSRVMTYDIFGGAHSAKVWHLERWTKTNIQTSAPPSKRPHICDGSHRLDEALPLLRILPCAQILFVPKILRNCQNVGVASWPLSVATLTRRRVQVVMAAKLAVGGQARRTPIWGEALGSILMVFSMNIEIWETGFVSVNSNFRLDKLEQITYMQYEVCSELHHNFISYF